MRCRLHVHYWGHTDHNPILHLGSHQEFAVEMTKAQSSCPTVFKCHGQICAVRKKKGEINALLYQCCSMFDWCKRCVDTALKSPFQVDSFDLHPVQLMVFCFILLKKKKKWDILWHFVAFCGIF